MTVVYIYREIKLKNMAVEIFNYVDTNLDNIPMECRNTEIERSDKVMERKSM
jgi:hypothetical protein